MSSKILSAEELMADIAHIVQNSYHATGTTVAHALLKKYLIIDSPKIDYKTDENFDITAQGVTVDNAFVHPDNYRHTLANLIEAADDFREMEAVEEAYKEFNSVSNKLKELATKLYIKANSGLVYTLAGPEDFFFTDIPRDQKDIYLEMAKLAMDFAEKETPKPIPATPPPMPEFNKTAPPSPWK